jgi:hypothetical protein
MMNIKKTGHSHITIVMSGPILTTLFPTDGWIGRSGSVDYLLRSPELTAPDFLLWGYLKDSVTEQSQQHFKSSGKKLKGVGQPSQQHLWWPHVSQLLTAVNSPTKLTVVILNTYVKV